jgi:hypothetical protein
MKSPTLALVVFFLCSCGNSNLKPVDASITVKPGVSKKVYEWFFKDHTYLVVTGSNDNLSITHAGHCSCFKK